MFLTLCAQGKQNLSDLFTVDKVQHVGKNNTSFPYGDYNLFLGKGDKRVDASERILEASFISKGPTIDTEAVHQMYLETFGGSSESEGEAYSDLSDVEE